MTTYNDPHALSAALNDLSLDPDKQHKQPWSMYGSSDYPSNSTDPHSFVLPVRLPSPTRSSTLSTDPDARPNSWQDDDLPSDLNLKAVQHVYSLSERDFSTALALGLKSYIDKQNTTRPRKHKFSFGSSRRSRDSQARGSFRGDDFPEAPDEPGPTRRVACPYHQADPQKFRRTVEDGKRFQTCPYGVEDIRRLKDHLTQVHAGPKHCCPNCSLVFNSKDEYNSHVPKKGRNHKKDYKCMAFEDPRFVHWSVLGKRRLDVFQRKGTRVCTRDAWYAIWDILFPGVQRQSPYKNPTLLEIAFDEAQEGVVKAMVERYRKEVSNEHDAVVFNIFTDEFYSFRAKLFQSHQLQSMNADAITQEAMRGPPSIFLETTLSKSPSEEPVSQDSAQMMSGGQYSSMPLDTAHMGSGFQSPGHNDGTLSHASPGLDYANTSYSGVSFNQPGIDSQQTIPWPPVEQSNNPSLAMYPGEHQPFRSHADSGSSYVSYGHDGRGSPNSTGHNSSGNINTHSNHDVNNVTNTTNFIDNTVLLDQVSGFNDTMPMLSQVHTPPYSTPSPAHQAPYAYPDPVQVYYSQSYQDAAPSTTYHIPEYNNSSGVNNPNLLATNTPYAYSNGYYHSPSPSSGAGTMDK